MQQDRVGTRLYGLMLMFLAGALVASIGCEATPPPAQRERPVVLPPTQPALAPTTLPQAVTLAGPMPREQASDTPFKRGRAIFMNRCTSCHEAQPIGEFTMDEWDNDLLPIMTVRAKLNPDQISDLKAYIAKTRSLMNN